MEYTLEPLHDNNFPTADQVTRQVFLTNTQLLDLGASGAFWTVNNHTWTGMNEHQDGKPYNNTTPSDNAPYLIQIYNEGSKAIPDYENAVQNHAGWDPEFNVYPARLGEVIDIILLNQPNGQDGGGRGTYNATENEMKLQNYRPIQRDTSFLYKYTYDDDATAADAYTDQGWRVWRLRVANPGVWMIHCPTLQHMVIGMQAVFVMGNSSQITRVVLPDLVEGSLTYGGDAYGNSTYDPLVTHSHDEEA
ncbi:L-ascorbate oxidase [Aspergillus affinis]|uniref:L-ascorbate oxidase n=1 Tax=Aspergillus affinis TaxID=1070780 RepID=UPI0022FF0C3B|nr:L-ascorbate oxidase [Aspergillus affinis]KAI9038587.1 L-ascorbate oxidase [Aspergillus affinis]